MTNDMKNEKTKQNNNNNKKKHSRQIEAKGRGSQIH